MLHLVDPEPHARWSPFQGVRPVAELRAGVWRIRVRWERALGTPAVAIHAPACAGFTELDEPPCISDDSIEGPAIIARSDFVPALQKLALAPDTRRLVHGEETVAWVVGKGERWPADRSGKAQEIEGIVLGGVFDLVTALEAFLLPDCLALLTERVASDAAGALILGGAGQVSAAGAVVEPGVVFDVRSGPVILDDGVEVRHGTRLTGPLYAGAGTRIVGGDIRNSVFGPHCVVRGEIASSVFMGYANKAHDGYVGHSVIGHWVNLGALTTTSNLKNTYGEIRLGVDGHQISTGRTNLGSLIGDHAKTAIGTMLPTGAVVGAGANVFGGNPSKWVDPFSWGGAGLDRLSEDGFLRIAERVMPRRKIEFSEARRESLRATYRRMNP